MWLWWLFDPKQIILVFSTFGKQQSQTNGLNVELRWPLYSVPLKIESDQIECLLSFCSVSRWRDSYLLYILRPKSVLASDYINFDLKCWRRGFRSQKRTMARITLVFRRLYYMRKREFSAYRIKQNKIESFISPKYHRLSILNENLNKHFDRI